MRDFFGPWNYSEVVRKIGGITHMKIFEFRRLPWQEVKNQH